MKNNTDNRDLVTLEKNLLQQHSKYKLYETNLLCSQKEQLKKH